MSLVLFLLHPGFHVIKRLILLSLEDQDIKNLGKALNTKNLDCAYLWLHKSYLMGMPIEIHGLWLSCLHKFSFKYEFASLEKYRLNLMGN